MFPSTFVKLLIHSALVGAGLGVATLLILILRDYRNGKLW